jgi:hypothetical protein
MADFQFRPERGKQHTVRATYFDETDTSKSLSLNAGIEFGREDLGSTRVISKAGSSWAPNDVFSANLGLNYTDSEAILVHRGRGAYKSYEGHQYYA